MLEMRYICIISNTRTILLPSWLHQDWSCCTRHLLRKRHSTKQGSDSGWEVEMMRLSLASLEVCGTAHVFCLNASSHVYDYYGEDKAVLKN